MRKISKLLFSVILLYTLSSCSENMVLENPGHVGIYMNDTVYTNTEHYLYPYYVENIWKDYSDSVVFVPLEKNKMIALLKK